MADDVETAAGELKLVAFRLAGELFGITITKVSEIILARTVTHVPGAAPDIDGVINLRGRIVPIVNLRRRLRIDAAEGTEKSRIVVVEEDGSLVGLVVDTVTGVLTLPKSKIEIASELALGVESCFVYGMATSADSLIILLNVERLLNIETAAPADAAADGILRNAA
jgi:purine-binding chemotaxis protein CheW